MTAIERDRMEAAYAALRLRREEESRLGLCKLCVDRKLCDAVLVDLARRLEAHEMTMLARA